MKPDFPIMTRGYVMDHVNSFKEWRKKLTKRERKMVNRPGKDAESIIVAIFETSKYGKVLWSQKDEDAWKKFLTPTESPNVQVLVHRAELLKVITEVRYASPFITEALVFHGSQTWCENQALKDFALKHKPAPRSIIRLPACGAKHEETEREMRRIYGSDVWDQKSDDEKDDLCELWESGRWPWESSDYPYRGTD